MGTAYYIHMNTQSSSLMINVATVNTKGISEDLSLIVKCCQIIVSEMMCQLLKFNNPCWSAVSLITTLIEGEITLAFLKSELCDYETNNLHGSGVIDQNIRDTIWKLNNLSQSHPGARGGSAWVSAL